MKKQNCSQIEMSEVLSDGRIGIPIKVTEAAEMAAGILEEFDYEATIIRKKKHVELVFGNHVDEFKNAGKTTLAQFSYPNKAIQITANKVFKPGTQLAVMANKKNGKIEIRAIR